MLQNGYLLEINKFPSRLSFTRQVREDGQTVDLRVNIWRIGVLSWKSICTFDCEFSLPF